MKNLFLLVALVTIVLQACKDDATPSGIPCIPSSLQNGLIAYYPFHQGSLQDESGNGHHLSNSTTASPGTDRAGNAQCAFQFQNNSGQNEFITTSQTAFLNQLNDFSVSLWYVPTDSNRTGGTYEALVHRDTGVRCPDRMGQWSVSLYDCRFAVFAVDNSVWEDNPAPGMPCDSIIAMYTGKWQHLTAVKTGGTIRLYKDGIFQSEEQSPADCGFGGLSPSQDIGDLFLGTGYTGRIDDVLMYNRALSDQEVMDLFELNHCCQ